MTIAELPPTKHFESINRGYNAVFQPGRLSVGVVVPIENYATSPTPTMDQHLERVRIAEALGYKAIWVRDIPLNVPAFGDAGQMYDPFTYLGYLAGQTKTIALGIASIALPLHHPVHIAKAAASVDQLSGGRVILGVASGDRPDEYPAMGIEFEKRAELFRASFSYIRQTQNSFPALSSNAYGHLNGEADILPKAYGPKLPMLVTGSSRQTLAWNAQNGDGWMNYPRNLYHQKSSIEEWRKLIPGTYDKPFMQPLYVQLENNDDFRPEPIPLGFRIGSNYLRDYLEALQDIGVNHVAINLRFNSSKVETALTQIAEKVLSNFHEN